MQSSRFGMIGLGTMGRNLVLNLAEKGISVCGYDRDPEQQQRLLDAGKSLPIQVAPDPQSLVNSLEKPRLIMLLVPAGKIVDAVISELSPLLNPGDILIDGGNSHYTDTNTRIKNLTPTGIRFIGMGVSGGESGARFGPSLMPGGDPEAWKALKDILQKIAAQTKDGPCVNYIGAESAGHYCKMVHNGIEYAIMQLISETYALLKHAEFTNEEIHKVFTDWNNGPLRSFLIEITAKIFSKTDDLTGTGHLVDHILDKASQKGTGMWTSVSALALHVPIPTIDEAVAARDGSALKTERMEISAFNKPAPPSETLDKSEFKQTLQDALYFGMAVSYVQGLHLLQAASFLYGYGINIAELLNVWKGGCIIRAAMLEELQQPYLENPGLKNILLNKGFYLHLIKHRDAVTQSINRAMNQRIPVPALASSLNYVDMFTTGNSAASLIQAQRDYFGAHGYERKDREGNFHSIWPS